VTLLRSFVMWGAAVCAVLFMLFVGYAIAVHESGPLITGCVMLLISAVLVFAQAKLARD